MKIGLNLKDFLKLCDGQDPEVIHNLNIDRYEVTKMLIKDISENGSYSYNNIDIARNLYRNISDLEFIEKFDEDLKLLSIYDLGIIFNRYFRGRRLNSLEIFLDKIGKKPSDYSINEIKNLLEEIDDEYLEDYIFIENIEENISSPDFEVCDKLLNMNKEYLEDIVKEFISHPDETTFRNSLEILKVIFSPMVYDSKDRRLSYLEEFRNKIGYNDHIELFDEAFSEFIED